MHPLLLILCLGLSLVILLGAAVAERSAILNGVNGANGIILLAALIVSSLGSAVVAGIVGILAGWMSLVATLVGSALYHMIVAKLLLCYFQALASRVASENKAKRA